MIKIAHAIKNENEENVTVISKGAKLSNIFMNFGNLHNKLRFNYKKRIEKILN